MPERLADGAARHAHAQLTRVGLELRQIRQVGAHHLVCTLNQPREYGVDVTQFGELTRAGEQGRQLMLSAAQA